MERVYIVDHNDITIRVDFLRIPVSHVEDFHGVQDLSYDEFDIRAVKLNIGGRRIELIDKLTEDQLKIITNLICES